MACASLGGVGERGEVAGADHAGLVDDQHAAGRSVAPCSKLDGQPGDRGRVDAGLVAQLARRAGRERAAEHGYPAALPGLDGGAERERLAGAGGGADDLDAVAAGQRRDELALLRAERRPRLERDADGVRVREAGVAAPARGGAVEQAALDLEQLARRVAPLAAVIGQRHDLRAGEEARSAALELLDPRAVAGGRRRPAARRAA